MRNIKFENIDEISSILTREAENPCMSYNGGDYHYWNTLYHVEYTECDVDFNDPLYDMAEIAAMSEKKNGFYLKEHTSCDMVDDSFETTFTDSCKGWGRILKVSFEEGLEIIENPNFDFNKVRTW